LRDTSHYRGLWLVAALKFVKGLALLALGIGALKLMHKDVAEELARWIDLLRVDPNNHYIHKLMEKLSILDDRKLRELSVGTFFYSAVLLAEGVGLALRQRWAEFVTIFTTTLLIPLEVYELARHTTFARVAILLINIAVVAYLALDLRRHPKHTGGAWSGRGNDTDQ